jgi:nicotinate-nucleotide--dimethylbenzimidazole phosphoribosyltransferase
MSESNKSTDWAAAAWEVLNHKTKPLSSLGYLEEIAVQLCVSQETLTPSVSCKRLCLFAGSHGVAAEGVSAYPASVTGQMVQNFLGGGAAINVLARQSGVDLQVFDVGVDAEPLPTHDNFHNFKIRRGTRNFLQEAAMTISECEQALEIGRKEAQKAQAEGVQLLGIGEMGIGNTTSASALCSALMGVPPKITVGRGTGVKDDALKNKLAVVTEALVRHKNCRTPQEWLAAIGGYEIAAMAGLLLEAAELRLPVVIDGFVATAAAVVARRMSASALDHCFWGHVSAEQAHATILGLLNARPILNLQMRLGEGTGAVLAMPLIAAAAAIMTEMASFQSAGVDSAVI